MMMKKLHAVNKFRFNDGKIYGEDGHSRECADHESIVCGMLGCYTDDTKCKLVKMCSRKNSIKSKKELEIS